MLGAEIVYMEALPYDQKALWYPDVGEYGTVVLLTSLDAAGRERALDELQAHWRETVRLHELARDTAARNLGRVSSEHEALSAVGSDTR